jgi:hypothetical protein
LYILLHEYTKKKEWGKGFIHDLLLAAEKKKGEGEGEEDRKIEYKDIKRGGREGYF